MRDRLLLPGPTLWAAQLLVLAPSALAQSPPTPNGRAASSSELRPAFFPMSTPPPPATLEPSRPPSAAALPKGQETLYRIILTGYRPNYFILGSSDEAGVKFQLSLKLDLWPNPSQHSLYFGYTQKAIWDLYGEPDGFIDSNYAPEVFYAYFKRLSDLVVRSGEVETFMDEARLGLLHESNGRDDTELRSTAVCAASAVYLATRNADRAASYAGLG